MSLVSLVLLRGSDEIREGTHVNVRLIPARKGFPGSGPILEGGQALLRSLAGRSAIDVPVDFQAPLVINIHPHRFMNCFLIL
jgi:hypothetical protein